MTPLELVRQELTRIPCACKRQKRATKVDLVGDVKVVESTELPGATRLACQTKCRLCGHVGPIGLMISTETLEAIECLPSTTSTDPSPASGPTPTAARTATGACGA